MTGPAAPRRGDGSHWRLRVACMGEAEALAALVNRAYEVERFFVNGTRTSPGEVQALIARGALFVAEDGPGQVAGTVQIEVEGDRGYFGMLAVESSLQGNGLGRWLVGAAEAHCRERGCARLWLAVVNLRGELQGWYRSLGFEVCGTEPFPLPAKLTQPCHLVLMEKALT